MFQAQLPDNIILPLGVLAILVWWQEGHVAYKTAQNGSPFQYTPYLHWILNSELVEHNQD